VGQQRRLSSAQKRVYYLEIGVSRKPIVAVARFRRYETGRRRLSAEGGYPAHSVA
jgi:hypothetical protein